MQFFFIKESFKTKCGLLKCLSRCSDLVYYGSYRALKKDSFKSVSASGKSQQVYNYLVSITCLHIPSVLLCYQFTNIYQCSKKKQSSTCNFFTIQLVEYGSCQYSAGAVGCMTFLYTLKGDYLSCPKFVPIKMHRGVARLTLFPNICRTVSLIEKSDSDVKPENIS